MSLTFVLSVILSVCLGPLVVFEGLRFHTLHQTCKKTHLENERLLQNNLCKDPWQRQLHGPKQESACRTAEEEMLLSPFSCAWKNLWSKNELVRVWFMIADSYVMILSIVVPCLIVSIVMLFWTCNESKTRNFQKEMFKEILRKKKDYERIDTDENVSYIEYTPAEPIVRKNSKYIQLINARN